MTSFRSDLPLDEILRLLPGRFYKTIPADHIERYTRPGRLSDGIPECMTGIWWTDAMTLHQTVTLATSPVDPVTRTASILRKSPLGYGNKATAGNPLDKLGSIVDDPLCEAYTVTFSEDYRHASYMWYRDVGGQRTLVEPGGWTMSLVEDGLWIRETKDQPNYSLRRIVDAAGQRTSHYAAYVDRFRLEGTDGSWNKVVVATPKLDIATGSLAIPLDLAAVDASGYIYIDLTIHPGEAGRYLITASGPGPLKLDLRSDNLDVFGKAKQSPQGIDAKLGAPRHYALILQPGELRQGTATITIKMWS